MTKKNKTRDLMTKKNKKVRSRSIEINSCLKIYVLNVNNILHDAKKNFNFGLVVYILIKSLTFNVILYSLVGSLPTTVK